MAKSMEAKFRARIARIAKGEVGQRACSRMTDGKPGYFTSCHGGFKEPEFWCSDFARWVWWKAGAINAAPGTKTPLNAAAGRFVLYGKLRRRPRVGDAVLFDYNHNIHDPVAAHVAIVVKVNPNGTIRSVSGDLNGDPGSDEHFAATSRVVHDKPYTSAIDSFGPNAPNGPVSGYVSPVEDDMPYTERKITELVKKGVAAELKARSTKQEILDLVKKGVAAELSAPIGTSGITPAQGAKAAVHAQNALAGLAQQLTDLTALVKALPAATQTPTGTTTTPTGTTTTPTGTRTPTRTTRTPTGTRTPSRTGTAPSGDRGSGSSARPARG
jgi:CHAP domain